MEFFNKIKSKLNKRNLILTVLLIILSSLTFALCFANGFSSEKILFISKWVISVFLLLTAAVFLGLALLFLRGYIKNTRFNKLLKTVGEIGDIDNIGSMLASMKKCKSVKRGEFKFNEKIIFYMKGSRVVIIPPEKLKSIKTEIESGKNGDETFIRIGYGINSLKLKTVSEDNLKLFEQLKETFKEFL